MANQLPYRDFFSQRVMADLQKRSSLGFIFYLLVPFCIFYSGGYHQRHPTLSFWAISVFDGIILLRLFYHLLLKKVSATPSSRSYRVFFYSVLVTAIVWGIIAASVLTQAGEEMARLLMAICTAGFCSGGVIAFLPARNLAILYNMLILLPVVLILVIAGENVALGLAILLYSLYLVFVTIRGNAEYWQALKNEYLLERKTEELKKESRSDALTGLFNRRHFEELSNLTLGLCIRRQAVITLIMCDIDHFKNVNDTYGHLAGDEYLKLVSSCLSEVFKRETDVIGRYGGEEFIILLPDEKAEMTQGLAETFRKRIEASPLLYGKEKIRTTVSIGMTCCVPQSGTTIKALINEADKALYSAKNAGRNRIAINGELCERMFVSSSIPR